MRMLVYIYLKNNLPFSEIPDILKSCIQLFNINVNIIPHISKFENVFRIRYLSDYITKEFMIKNRNLTLGFYSTTQERVHINAININNKHQVYSVIRRFSWYIK